MEQVWNKVENFITEKNLSYSTDDDESLTRSGIISIDDKLLVFSSQPIITSLFKGPIKGTIFIARLLDDEQIKSFSENYYLDLSLYNNLDIKQIINKNEKIENVNEEEGNYFITKQKDCIYGYLLIYDFFGNPCSIIKIKDKRNIFIKGVIAFRYLIFYTMFFIVFMVVVSFIIIERNFIKRIMILSKGIDFITRSHNSATKIELKGKDELSFLANGINKMLDSIYSYRDSLFDSEKKYYNLIETLPDIFFTMSKEGRILSLNLAFEKILGLKREDYLGKRFSEVIYKDDIKLAKELFFKIFNGETVNTFELRVVDKTENLKVFELTLAPIKKNDKTIGEYGIARDITARKMAEELIQNEKERLAVTLKSIGDAVITTDTDGIIVLMNQVAEFLTEWSEEEAIGKNLSEVFRIINQTTRNVTENPVEKVIKTGKIISMNNHTILITKNGKELIISESGAPIKDTDGKIIGVVLVFRDISEKEKMEKEIFKARKLESLGVLAGGLAHDFNNILTGVIGNITLARFNMDTKDNVEIYKILNEAENASYQATSLTKQLLTFAKGGAPIKKVTSIKKILTETTNFVLRGTNVKSIFLIDEDLHNVEVDEGQMEQVFSNIIINAVQSMINGGNIKIIAQNYDINENIDNILMDYGEYIKISIEDQGQGISEDNINKIFDPYFSTKEDGNGLGLSTVYSIIKKHNGYIWVDSKLGLGSVFNIYLHSVQREVKDEIKNRSNEIIKGEGRVLVMDDEEVIRMVILKMLADLGYNAQYSKNGEDAIKLYQESIDSDNPFDVVILDLTVPGGMGGVETLKRLKEIDPNVVTIVSSGYSNEEVISCYKEYGFTEMLLKPYKFEDLSKVLNSVLSKK